VTPVISFKSLSALLKNRFCFNVAERRSKKKYKIKVSLIFLDFFVSIISVENILSLKKNNILCFKKIIIYTK